MQKKFILSFFLFSMNLSSIHAQDAEDTTYKKFFIGSTFLMLGNFIPNDPNRPDFIQLNAGYRITPEDVVFLEFKTSKFSCPFIL